MENVEGSAIIATGDCRATIFSIWTIMTIREDTEILTDTGSSINGYGNSTYPQALIPPCSPTSTLTQTSLGTFALAAMGRVKSEVNGFGFWPGTKRHSSNKNSPGWQGGPWPTQTTERWTSPTSRYSGMARDGESGMSRAGVGVGWGGMGWELWGAVR